MSDNDIRWFKEVGIGDIPLVGGKNASLGEMYRELMPKGIKVPNGFAVTASAYRDMLSEAGAWDAPGRAWHQLDQSQSGHGIEDHPDYPGNGETITARGYRLRR